LIVQDRTVRIWIPATADLVEATGEFPVGSYSFDSHPPDRGGAIAIDAPGGHMRDLTVDSSAVQLDPDRCKGLRVAFSKLNALLQVGRIVSRDEDGKGAGR
jgi:hypothetical protein